MKKFKLSLFAFLLITLTSFLGTAYAVQFSLDLSTINANYGTYEDIFRINVDGFAEVDQSFGDNNIFDDGDTFTEMTLLQEISYKNSLAGSNKFFTDLATEGKIMYLYAAGLTGYADVISASDPTDLATYVFDYYFNPGVGSIGIYIDNDTGSLEHNAGTAELVASFSLESGDGAGADGFLGGLDNAGTSRLTGEFLSGTPDNVWEAAGLDLGNLPAGYAAFAELNTTNQAVAVAQYDSDSDGKFDGFEATINSTGHMTVNVVPEPGTFLLLGIGLLGVANISRRKRG